MRLLRAIGVLSLLYSAAPLYAEVTTVSITSRATVANGQAFGEVGAYEKLSGTIEFALDPANPHNKPIADLEYAPRGADGRVHFVADLYVLRPVATDRGNGALLFEVSNRGRKGLLGRFNRAPGANSTNPQAPADFGDGFLMREGYTLVWIGWEFDVPPPLLRLQAPPVAFPPGLVIDPLRVEIVVNQRTMDTMLTDDAGRPPVLYPPADPDDDNRTLTVRDRFWDPPTVIPRERWRFLPGPDSVPLIRFDDGFEPGRAYEVSYRAADAVLAGAGMAAIRDAASAFKYRPDLPVQGKLAYVFGISQSGRFLREFIHDGFNVDEQDRRVFDAIWPHIAGASLGPFNRRFATPAHGVRFTATRFPFADLEQADADGTRDGLQRAYRPDQLPKVFHTNTSVEYWGGGRAAALTHTSVDGKHDLAVPDNVRIYLLAGTQHGEAAFPPTITNGQLPNNPTPQADVMRALLRALHAWAANDAPPPASRYPRLSDSTLVAAGGIRFPSLPRVGDPRTITGPARVIEGAVAPLPFLVPQVDADGNEIGGIRVPDLAVPLATVTGWNFRSPGVGNPGDIYPLLGSYFPFARTRAERRTGEDPRPSIEERYRGKEEYLQNIRATAADLIKGGYLLAEDLGNVIARADAHWDYVTRAGTASPR